jgi:hypothetical protein
MKITSISYKKIFPIAQYVNETIGIEIQVDEGDDTDEAFKIAKETVEQWAMNRLAQEYMLNGEATKETYSMHDGVVYEDNDESIVSRRIEESRSLPELGEWKEEAAKLGLMKIYMTKAKKLASV